MKLYGVGVFEHPGKRRVLLMAYIHNFQPSWPGCCLHRVIADSGVQAKAMARGAHRDMCMLPSAKGKA